ncbi:tyrosine--tRNA ligase [Alicyclobacillus vulcanalis]|uniref:Tyrosine--tRNA ligase n=1 Tax=Alicyclobacillus vulcanalis TaxID=252246 RepID=A0A1N7P9U6_9BACL|nr:tyrosine--tRNA ligase [Alicyclobacillus vulcanalis]SIT07318.1 tyrosyl-tRNA synthetase [Alicyclobacillus vulcanalis]
MAVETLTPDQEAEVSRQLAVIRRGTAEIVPEDELVQKLRDAVRTGRPLRVKLGIDPTSSDIHLGHTVVLHKLRQFQDLGHQVFLVIGSFTGQIGDPTDKAETRKQLSAEEVAENAKTYVEQLYKILDPQKTQVVYNGDWLAPLTFAEVIRLASTITVARMFEREDFQKRFQDNRPIHIHEFFYPLMQAYDSVHLNADVELGGTDQKFNLLMGRHLQREFGQPMQVAVMLPLLEGLDGVHKMSKSLGNYIGVNESPNDMFGKLMSVPDSLLFKYYELLSLREQDEIDRMRAEVEAGRMNPRDAKMQLAEELVERFLGPEARREAVEHWHTVFQKGGLPEDIPERRVAGAEQWIVKWLVELGLAQSNSDARRAIQEGGVRLNGEKLTDTDYQYRPKDGDVLQRGKRQFVRLRIE